MDPSGKARLRQQLLSSENDINTLSGFAASGRLQFAESSFPPQRPMHAQNPAAYPQNPAYPQQQNYSNHDVMTPVAERGGYPHPGSRKASMASMSSMSMQRLFRRKGDGGHFDEEAGADINDVAGSNLSFTDITHIRGTGGRYNTMSFSSMDTAPIIPVLGAVGSNGAKSLNNVQYRKYMNHQKKLNLAQSARAMSLAGGGNPMAPDQHTMSMNLSPNNSRAMSLGNPMNQNQGPRAMSLNSNVMLRSGPPGQQRPRPNMNGQYMPNQYGQMPPNQQYMGQPHMGQPMGQQGMGQQPMGPYVGHNMNQYNGQGYPQGMAPGGPRTASLRSGNYPQSYRGPPPTGRANSLSNNAMGMGPLMQQQYQGPMNNGQLPGGPYQSMAPNRYNPQGQFAYQNGPQQNGLRPEDHLQGQAQGKSTDSFMNLVEEEDEKDFDEKDDAQPPVNAERNTEAQRNVEVPETEEQHKPGPVRSQSLGSSSLGASANTTLPAPLAPPSQAIKAPFMGASANTSPPLTAPTSPVKNAASPVLAASSLKQPSKLGASANTSLPLSQPGGTHDLDDEDTAHVYKFEEGESSPQLSRKSTVKRSNSKRVRKLDLFKRKPPSSPEPVYEDSGDNGNVEDADIRGDRLSKKLMLEFNDGEMKQYQLDLAEKFKAIGASASGDKDVFTTAPEFISPAKKKKSRFSKELPPPPPGGNAGLEELSDFEERQKDEQSYDYDDNVSMAVLTVTKDSSYSNDTQGAKRTRPIKLRSLVANTAFSNFRSPSMSSQQTFGLELAPKDSAEINASEQATPMSPVVDQPELPSPNVTRDMSMAMEKGNPEGARDSKHSPFDQFDEPVELSTSNDIEGPTLYQNNHYEEAADKHSESESQSSVYTTDTPKRSDIIATLESSSSEHQSPSAYSPEKINTENSIRLEDASNDAEQPGSNYSRDVPVLNYSDAPLSVLNEGETKPFNEDANVQPNQVELDYENGQKASEMSDLNAIPDADAVVRKRAATISRSNSELKLQGLLPTGGLIRREPKEPISSSANDSETEKSDRRRSASSSISYKSKNFMKRLSRSGSKRTDDVHDDGTLKQRVASTKSLQEPARAPLKFSKDELAIMTCNNDLQNELHLVTSELAMSIKRELKLELQLRTRYGLGEDMLPSGNLIEEQLMEKTRALAEMQDKLNNERRLRFISEEHAILAEHGQSPSALKLDYEKNEIYKQLLAKNDLVNQLQDRLDELDGNRNSDHDEDFLHKYNDLLKENSELKMKLDETQKQASSTRAVGSVHNDQHSAGDAHEYDQAQILSLRTQRDELREMITKLTSAKDVELKIAQERIKTLEEKLENMSMISDKLTRRQDKGAGSAHGSGTSTPFGNAQGGKLQGLAIVSPTKRFFD